MRSIPACAGEPWAPGRIGWMSRVYPRVCGGTPRSKRTGRGTGGLSPRVRGNLDSQAGGLVLVGSIPACAGEPGRGPGQRRRCGVYPRVCGGTGSMPLTPAGVRGLSPRVRGNRGVCRQPRIQSGSIPACAGEPGGFAGGRVRHRVYPRVCGGTRTGSQPHGTSRGLSPRVRGNPPEIPPVVRRIGSIPACAGEPPKVGGYGKQREVYPRVCGGTPSSVLCKRMMLGLSPRVRGNRKLGVRHNSLLRSIPACAGEPRCRRQWRRSGTVYPRVCGGTAVGDDAVGRVVGLSPRVRGNRAQPRQARCQIGSIPACAGEPAQGRRIQSARSVYPRVCGGTPTPRRSRQSGKGLSPRVRGNLGLFRHQPVQLRSIPACAGEP